MECRQRQIALQLLASGELPASQRPALEAHLRRCRRCRRELAAFRELFAALPEMPSAPVPEGLHDELMTALSPYREALRVRRESRAWVVARRVVGIGIGAAFAVTLVASLWEWLGRIFTFTGRSFSQDLAPLWSAAKDLWYLLQLLVDVLRILEPAASNLWMGLRQTHEPLLQLAPLVFAAYGTLVLLGGWLCWRALFAAERRRWNHAS
ncbi:MAG: hypothetical protein GF330_02935 [Candidatus Eisenbacteria bacterium]|nr:hypothetical protein [Candidatus Eisenbacteria bacterium]